MIFIADELRHRKTCINRDFYDNVLTIYYAYGGALESPYYYIIRYRTDLTLRLPVSAEYRAHKLIVFEFDNRGTMRKERPHLNTAVSSAMSGIA